MLALLPFLSGALLTLIFYSYQKSWRSSVLAAAVSLGVFIALFTEALSFSHLINLNALVTVWLLLTGSLIIIIIRRQPSLQALTSSSTKLWHQLKRFDKVSCVGVGMIVLTVGIISIVAPPNNWDSMSYVMPRVIHWMQNHSVEHYPTHYTAQINMGPYAEFTLTHLQILSGGDWLANVPQWLSMIGCLLGVSLISKQLGADLRGQLFSVLVCATIPVGILQASNSKNTYVVAFWLVCLNYYGILLVKNQLNWSLVFAVSASFSLAVLTKGTAYIYALPLLVWLFFSAVVSYREKAVKYLMGAGAIFLIINFGNYFRIFLTFGSPLSTYPVNLTNEVYSLSVFISSIIRNISLHLTLPFFSSEKIDFWVNVIHRFLGVDPVDPRLNLVLGAYRPTEFTTQNVQLFEDTAGNSFHFWLTLLAITLFLKNKKLRNDKLLLTYCLTTVFSFLMFCLLLKWQLWHSRLHLPIFVLMCPFIGIVLAQAVNRRLAQSVLIILLVTSSPYVLLNETRPIAAATNIFNTDRITQYFAARSTLQADYLSAANLAKQHSCYAIGLLQRPDAWEYPLWLLLAQKSQRSIRVENVNVTNPSNEIEQNTYYQAFQPCMLVSIGLPSVQQVTVHHQIYDASIWRNTDTSEPMQVFFKHQSKKELSRK